MSRRNHAVNAPFELLPEKIEARLRTRLTPLELFALLFAVGMLLMFAYSDATYNIGAFPDYRTFIKTAEGVFGSETGGFFYAHWSRPLFSLLNLLPIYAGYVLWGILNIAGVWFAARVFGGRLIITLLSYQMFYVLYYGNIVGVIAGGLALLWWMLHRGRPEIAGIGLVIACIKVQLGLPFGLMLILLADVTWMQRARALLVLLIVGLLSLVVYPGWLETLIDTTRTVPPNTLGNIALWQYVGAGALVLWLPMLYCWRGWNNGRRLAAFGAALALTLPYFQQTDLLVLFVLPVGWLAILGNVGFLFLVMSWSALKLLVIVPLVLYGWVVGAGVREKGKAKNV